MDQYKSRSSLFSCVSEREVWNSCKEFRVMVELIVRTTIANLIRLTMLIHLKRRPRMLNIVEQSHMMTVIEMLY